MFVVRDRIKVGLWRESSVKLVFLDHPTTLSIVHLLSINDVDEYWT